MKKILLVLCFFICGFNIFGHSGRTDENGGHYNHRTGEYHYHNNGHKGRGGFFWLVFVGGSILFYYYLKSDSKRNKQ